MNTYNKKQKYIEISFKNLELLKKQNKQLLYFYPNLDFKINNNIQF